MIELSCKYIGLLGIVEFGLLVMGRRENVCYLMIKLLLYGLKNLVKRKVRLVLERCFASELFN